MALRRLLLTASVALVCTAGVAKADTIATLDLSSHSSDATPAAWLLATFTFTVSAGGTHLDLTVTNNTSNLFGTYDINEIYFNGPGGGLTLTEVGTLSGWGPGPLVSSDNADGFGVFDFAMHDVGGSPNAISAGASLVFHFAIGNGTATASDFVDNFSTIPPGDTPSLIAAKFIHGPVSPDSPDGDDSAYGALIPLPPALPMGLVGLLGVVFFRRRK